MNKIKNFSRLNDYFFKNLMGKELEQQYSKYFNINLSEFDPPADEKKAKSENPTENNPIASYVKYFTVPQGWNEVFVSFQGVDSAMALWLNGKFVGYSEDSCTPSEFDLTPYLVEGENKLAVQVYRFSSASWLEDQDFDKGRCLRKGIMGSGIKPGKSSCHGR